MSPRVSAAVPALSRSEFEPEEVTACARETAAETAPVEGSRPHPACHIGAPARGIFSPALAEWRMRNSMMKFARGEISGNELLEMTKESPLAAAAFRDVLASDEISADGKTRLAVVMVEALKHGAAPGGCRGDLDAIEAALRRLAALMEQGDAEASPGRVEPILSYALIEIASLHPNRMEILTDVVSTSRSARGDAHTLDFLARSWAEFFQESAPRSGTGIRRADASTVGAAFRVMRETGSASFLAYISPYLPDRSLPRLLATLRSGNHDEGWWRREAKNIGMLVSEASQREGAPAAARAGLMRLALRRLPEGAAEDALSNWRFTAEDRPLLEEIAGDRRAPRGVRFGALGHLCRLFPGEHAAKAQRELTSRFNPVESKTMLLRGMRGTEAAAAPFLAEAVKSEYEKMKNGGRRLDTQLSGRTLPYVIALREVARGMGLEQQEFLDPPDELNRRMRALGPRGTIRQRSEGALDRNYFSEFGFIAQHDDYREIVRRDAQALDRAGLTREEVAAPLIRIREHYLRTGETQFPIEISGRVYEVEQVGQGGIRRAGWHQSSPFVDSSGEAEFDFNVTDPATGEQFFFFGLMGFLIKEHGFFEGDVGTKEKSFRIEPERIIGFFRLAE